MNSIFTFILNGKKYYANNKISLSALLAYFNYQNSLVIIQYNELIFRKAWDNIYIKNNDYIQIITIVGGG